MSREVQDVTYGDWLGQSAAEHHALSPGLSVFVLIAFEHLTHTMPNHVKP